MKEVKMNKVELVARLTENRNNHRAEFEKALDEYKEALLTYLNERIEDIRSGKLVDHYISLPQPEDHTDSYDQELEMLAMSIDNEVVLSHAEFRQYVRDDWGWKGEFAGTTETLSMYNASKR